MADNLGWPPIVLQLAVMRPLAGDPKYAGIQKTEA